ncbi:MAG: peptidoglycan DD-metalloendopeptidase family protein [Bacteroidales bacterium]|nr:peptidoglycan DD-metalloendopeptidase family protein [Bacteroidales bacterium]
MHKLPFRNLTIIALVIVLGITVILAIMIFSYRKANPEKNTPGKPHIAYKINIDSMDMVTGEVSLNENLSSILAPYVSGQIIDKIARETRHIFDVRKIRAGNTYAKISSKDSVHRLLYFIYEMDEIDFIVYDFRDSLRVYSDKKKVTRLNRTAQGTITSSLWNCFLENRLDINLGLSLSDVFGWTVDFYGLQKGDSFKVIYDELFVDNVPVGVDRIQAAVFSSGGKDFYAYYYDQPGGGDYFDNAGQSLRRSFLKAPLKFSRISSRYTASRMHPILRIARPHFGVDYAAPRGTPVVALGDGRINEMGWHGGYGRFISIRHNSTYTSTYAHLSGYAKGLKSGSMVKQGELIGYVGSSGLSTGAHLDFRVYKNGSPTNPLKLESPAANPVDPSTFEKFRKMAAAMKTRLDSIR